MSASSPRFVTIADGDPLSDPSLAAALTDRFVIWDAFVGDVRRVDLHPLVLPRTLHEEIAHLAEQTVRVMRKVGEQALVSDEEAARYGFSDQTLRLARASHGAGDHGALMRLDILLDTALRPRVCEINADSPGGHNEAVGLPSLARAAGHASDCDPTTLLEELTACMRQLVDPRCPRVGYVYATAFADDMQIGVLLRRALAAVGVECALLSMTALRLRPDGLYAHGKRVSVLYRHFPTEYMDGMDNVEDIAVAVERGQVRTLTSFMHMFVQSKLAFARAFHATSALTEADRAIVQAALPETHAFEDVPITRLLAERETWVVKRALGRVGDQVIVGPLTTDVEWGGVLHTVQRLVEGQGERWIVQKFVPQMAFSSPYGGRLVTLGAYVLNGRFVGYFTRATRTSHVSHDALCVPVFVDERPEARACA